MFIERVNSLIKEKVNNPNVVFEKNHDRLYVVLNGEDHLEVIKGLDKVLNPSNKPCVIIYPF